MIMNPHGYLLVSTMLIEQSPPLMWLAWKKVLTKFPLLSRNWLGGGAGGYLKELALLRKTARTEIRGVIAGDYSNVLGKFLRAVIAGNCSNSSVEISKHSCIGLLWVCRYEMWDSCLLGPCFHWTIVLSDVAVYLVYKGLWENAG